MASINLDSPLTFSNSFRFPLQSPLAKRELFIGGALILLPFVGWLLNMGHRIQMVHRMQHGLPAWPAWQQWGTLLKNGVITWLGMVYYYIPGGAFIVLGRHFQSPILSILGALLLLLATIAIPGYMSHYCLAFDASEIYNPLKAMRRVFEGGKAYWKAWLITLSALGLSFLGLLALGIGFLFSSVWFWQAAGFSFATVFSDKFKLHSERMKSC